MLPQIPPDSFIFSIKLPKTILPVNKFYYINHPKYGHIVKTLDKIEGDIFWFSSESEIGITTEQIGGIKYNQIIGRVVLVVKP